MNDTLAPAAGTNLPVVICLGWGTGAVTMAMMSNIFNLLVLRFATDFLGIAAGLAGVLLASSKLYDAVSDPVVGAVSDNWHSQAGRRRPFLLLAAFLSPAAILALFFVPRVEGGLLLVYYLAALILFATAFAVWCVPYLAMAAEMTEDYHERSRLVSYRVNGGAVGLLISSIGGPSLLAYLGGDRRAYQTMAIVMATLILLSGLICYRSTRAAPFHLSTRRSQVPLREELRMIAGNRPLSLLLTQKAFWYFGFAANQAALAYFIKYVARLSDFWLGAYYIVLPVGMIAAQPLWLEVARRLDKKYASMLAMGLFGVLELTWLLTGPEEGKWVIVLRLLGLGGAAGGAILLIQSMFNDTIEFNYRRTQQRREGAFTGLFSLVEKGFTAFGVAALGGFLGVMGYVSSQGQGLVHQPRSAVAAIAIGFCVVPFVTACCAVGTIFFYGLNSASLAREDLR